MERSAMSPADLQPHELMQRVADACERLGVAYWVVGSIASMAYGEPRFTNDVDIVVDLSLEHAAAFCEAFPSPDYYCSEPAAREAIAFRLQFNILHPESGLKADIIVPSATEFSKSEASRVRRIASPGEYSALFGSPEDVLLNKLIYYRIGGGVSDKHIRDIAGMLKLQKDKLDFGYITEWASKLNVVREWDMVRQQVGLD